MKNRNVARGLPVRWTARLAVAVLVAGSLVACGDKPGAPGAGGAPGGGMPPTPVGVVTVAPGDVGLVTELPGRLEATRVAQVRARAAGILQKRLFAEGSEVKAGQTLFRIDAAPYQATLQSAEAQLARAEASHAQASAQAERFQPLFEAKAISKQDYDNALAARKQTEADVAAARAGITNARINLGHTVVTAPIAGRIGRALVTEGALVGQGEATQLAVIQQINPIYVNFTQPANEVLRLRKALESGKFQRVPGAQGANVRVVLDDGSEYAKPGKLLFSDLSVDEATGQVMLRAEVPNPDGLLLPGMYVRVRIEQAQVGGAILLPQQAVTRGSQGDTVMVVGADGKVGPRPVKIGNAQNGQWVVLDGLKAGDQVMVDGFQKLRPGATVKAVPWQPGGALPATQPAAAK